MNKHKSLKSTQSLLERASDLYGFNNVMRGKPQVGDNRDIGSIENDKRSIASDAAKSDPAAPISAKAPPSIVPETPPVAMPQTSLGEGIESFQRPVDTYNDRISEAANQAQVPITEPAAVITAPDAAMPVVDVRPLQANPLQANPLQASPLQASPLQASPQQASPQQASPLQASPQHVGASNDAAVDNAANDIGTEQNLSQSDRFAADKLYRNKEVRKIDRQWLSDNNLLVPDGPVTALSEEFRIVKRQLLLAARGGKGVEAVEHGERILICSANPNEGKTYTSVNLALSMASEKDNRVLLIDADFAKPSVLSTLNIEGGPGLMDALADPSLDVNQMVLSTDVSGLSVLPAGSQSNQDTEYLAAARTAKLIEKLSKDDPSRIIIFDSPPALAASPASVLALHVGQTLMVVHADKTTDSALRDALNLLSGCDHVQLLLNRANFSPSGRKFGSYYGYGA